MTTVSDICQWMEAFAPLALAEDWDNVGLLLGDPTSNVDRVMTCLTVTPTTVDEAIAQGAELIVTHHPILFRPVQKLVADAPGGALAWRLARAGVAVYSPHTAFDNCEHGINAELAQRLGLRDVEPLRLSKSTERAKVIAFVPRPDRERVMEAAFSEGAGRIGDYEQCSFTAAGRGSFFGGEATRPAIGEPGRRETVREWRIEFACDLRAADRVAAAIRSACSYEEPAIDVVPLRAAPAGPGIGRVGMLPNLRTLDALASTVRSALGCGPVGAVGDGSREIRKVAIACGAGDDFLADALRAGAEALLTGEARYHRAIEAESSGLALILAGHHASERVGVEGLADRLQAAFSGLRIWPSRQEVDPVRYPDA